MIFLHIGRHKTGTSSLQQFLRRNRDALGVRGLTYVPPARGGPANHDLANALNPAWMARADAAGLAIAARELEVAPRRLRQAGDKIVSSEAFQNVPPQTAADFFPAGQVTVIAYLREQLDYLLSAYAQFIQAQPSRMGFIDYASQLGARHDSFLDGWTAAFGAAAVRPRLYAREHLADGDIRRDFLARIGADPEGLWFDDALVNPSIGPELIEAKGLINAFVPQAVQAKADLYTLLGGLTERMPGRLGVSPAFAGRLRARFAESNARLFAGHLAGVADGFPMKDFTPESAPVDRLAALDQALALIDETSPEAGAALREHLPGRPELAATPALLPQDWNAATATVEQVPSIN